MAIFAGAWPAPGWATIAAATMKRKTLNSLIARNITTIQARTELRLPLCFEGAFMSASDSPERHPVLASALEQNIRSVFAQHERVAASRSMQDRISDAITDFSGRMVFVYFHVVWFAIWIAWNLGAFASLKPFDP